MTKQKQATIRVRDVGQSYGHRADLVARNGRVLWTSPPVPYGMPQNAHALAAAEAAVRGYTVAGA